MKKKKLLIQITICLIIGALYGLTQITDHDIINSGREEIAKAVSRHYTLKEIAESGKTAISTVLNVPVSVANYIVTSQELQKYGEPANEIQVGETGSVYSVAGGEIIETGTEDDGYSYIKIRHQSAVSIYGNCSRIYVKKGESVRKGQLIASFEKTEENDLYYKLYKE